MAMGYDGNNSSDMESVLSNIKFNREKFITKIASETFGNLPPNSHLVPLPKTGGRN
jgi:hypothetical protein